MLTFATKWYVYFWFYHLLCLLTKMFILQNGFCCCCCCFLLLFALTAKNIIYNYVKRLEKKILQQKFQVKVSVKIIWFKKIISNQMLTLLKIKCFNHKNQPLCWFQIIIGLKKSYKKDFALNISGQRISKVRWKLFQVQIE